MDQYPPSPLTVGSWVRLSLMGQTYLYGQILGLDRVITLGVPATPETETQQATEAATYPIGYSALYRAHASTEVDVRIHLATHAPLKPRPVSVLSDWERPYPNDWNPETLVAFRDLRPETRAIAMECHHQYRGLDQFQCAGFASRVQALIEGGMSKEDAIKAEDEIPF